jgi:ribonuclease VapC
VIVDSSALIAILAGEPDADKLNDILSSAARPALSVANYLEAAIVLDRHRARGAGERLDRYLVVAQVEFAVVTESQARIARTAYRNFGKATGHPAGLNFGDCFAYALAIERDEPLLYKATTSSTRTSAAHCQLDQRPTSTTSDAARLG